MVEHFGWESIFYVNVPFGILAVILTVIYVKETPSYGKNQRIDFIGMALSTVSLFAIVYGLIVKEGHPHWDWTDGRVAGWLIGGLVLLIIFIVAESKIKEPMVNLKMFKSAHFVGIVIVAFTLGAGIYSYNTFLTALMQNYIAIPPSKPGFGNSPSASGH